MMPRTPQQILQDIIGAQVVQIATVIAENETLKEQLAAAAQPTPAVTREKSGVP